MESKILQEISKSIAKDELGKAIKKLSNLLKDNPLLDEIVQQSGRYNSLKRQIRLGILENEKIEISKNKIRLALLEMLSELDYESENESENENVREGLKKQEEEKNTIIKSKNVNIGNVNTEGGDFKIGDS